MLWSTSYLAIGHPLYAVAYSLWIAHICKSKEVSQPQNTGGINEGLNHEMVKVSEEFLEGEERKRQCSFCSRKQNASRWK